MVEGLTEEEIAKLKQKEISKLQKKSVKSQIQRDYLRETNPNFAKAREKLVARKQQEGIRNIKRQNVVAAQKRSGLTRFQNATRTLENTSGREVGRRASIVKRLLAPSKGHAGPGRPRGSYKYGAPIQQVQKIQAQRKAMAQLQAQKMQIELTRKGYTPEQIQEILSQQQFQGSPEEYQQLVAEANVSPNTQRILEEIRRIQGKGKADDANMQRIIRERKMVNQQMNLMNTPNIFKAIPGQMEGWLEHPETNPLRAPNIFAEDRTRNPSILDTQGRPTILNAVQKLNFFEDPLRQQQQQNPNQPIKPTRLNFWKS